MPAVIILGAQWGDEGKGKATDQLGTRAEYVVKYNGGNNAGHTVVVDGEKFARVISPLLVILMVTVRTRSRWPAATRCSRRTRSRVVLLTSHSVSDAPATLVLWVISSVPAQTLRLSSANCQRM